MGTAAPFAFFALHVVRTRRLSPGMTRITLGGADVTGFRGGGRDQSFSLFLPQPHQSSPVLPTGDDWFARWRAMDPYERAVMRSYTVRAERDGEIDVDFALHSDGGPAARWAARARPGDRVTVLGPSAADNKSVGFRPPPDTDWVLLAGDETALPAIAAILEWLPGDTPVRVFAEVPHRGDVQDLRGDGTWLVREESARHRTDRMLGAVRAARLPSGVPYAWIAGESGTVRALRRHLVRERGVDRRRVTFSGYWRLGASEEQLADEAVAGVARVPDD